jgi:glucosamine--fructose-6-phosphate aminotransferase (isomerizing)
VFLTKAGAEIGVASTKAFTTQLVALALLVLVLGRRHGLGDESYHTLLSQLRNVPSAVDVVLALDRAIESLAAQLFQRRHALYLGRGTMHPVAMEGALKLKEISYIHAEAYAAGELKHGPLALVDQDMPVIALAPYNELTEKLLSNIEEVRARRGKLYIFADPTTGLAGSPDFEVTVMPSVETFTAPIIYTIPLQLLAYHVALLRGTDVDQPRNLAKSVTVE